MDKDLVQAYAEEVGRERRLAPREAYGAALDAFLSDKAAFRRAHAGRLSVGTPTKPPAVDVSSLMTRAERPGMNSPLANRRNVSRTEVEEDDVDMGPEDAREPRPLAVVRVGAPCVVSG